MAVAADPDALYGCHLSLLRLSQASPKLMERLLDQPKAVLQEFNAALPAAQQQLISELPAEDAAQCAVKADIQIRLQPLPAMPGSSCSLLHPHTSKIRCRHSQRLVTVTGTVVRTGVVNVLESHRVYECKACRHR